LARILTIENKDFVRQQVKTESEAKMDLDENAEKYALSKEFAVEPE
jgi:hypothetical protein